MADLCATESVLFAAKTFRASRLGSLSKVARIFIRGYLGCLLVRYFALVPDESSRCNEPVEFKSPLVKYLYDRLCLTSVESVDDVKNLCERAD
jgi:hypothetical protein